MNREFQFIEHVDPTEFNKLAFKEGVKSHFLGSEQYGKVEERRGRIVHYVGMEKDGNLFCRMMMPTRSECFGKMW